jgi:hypothetical protein
VSAMWSGSTDRLRVTEANKKRTLGNRKRQVAEPWMSWDSIKEVVQEQKISMRKRQGFVYVASWTRMFSDIGELKSYLELEY